MKERCVNCTCITHIIQNELIEKGEKNFMLINVPPIHRAPMWHNTENEKLIETRVIGQFVCVSNVTLC